MLILGSAFFGVLIFLAILLVTIILGAVARETEKGELVRTELERRAGLGGDVTDQSHPVHDRYLET
jgi:CHASE1-domain containing sensor protein